MTQEINRVGINFNWREDHERLKCEHLEHTMVCTKCWFNAVPLYLAVIEDRHTDVEVEVFTTKESAIEFAKSRAEENGVYPEDYVEKDCGPSHELGWVFHAQYSVEDDYVTVVEVYLDRQRFPHSHRIIS